MEKKVSIDTHKVSISKYDFRGIDLALFRKYGVKPEVICKVACLQIENCLREYDRLPNSHEKTKHVIYQAMKELDLVPALELGVQKLQEKYDLEGKDSAGVKKQRKYYDEMEEHKGRALKNYKKRAKS